MVSIRRIPDDVIKPWKLPKQTTYILHNGNVIDVVEGVVHREVTITISEGRIESIRKASELKTYLSLKSHKVIDCSGKYICPGLIDCHVHVTTTPGESTLDALFSTPPDVSQFRQPYVVGQMLDRGFTSVRDCGGANLALKQAIDEGAIRGPRLFISGHGISQTGGHGDTRKAHEPGSVTCGGHARGLGRVADGVAECQKAVREELRSGADFIKIMCSGGVASPTDKLESTQYSAKEIRAMTEVADNMGTYVSAHAYTPKSIQQAIMNGVRGIEHGNLIDKETAELMVSKGCFLTPTLVTYATMASDEFAGFLTPENIAKNKAVLKVGLNSIKIAHEAGLVMCYGSDLLGPMGYAQSGEFRLRRQVLDAKTVLQSATVNAARLLRQEESLGQVKEGFMADLLILNGNPLDDIEMLEKKEEFLLAVVKGGRVFASQWSKFPVDIGPGVHLIE